MTRTNLAPFVGAYAGPWVVIDARQRSGAKSTLLVLRHHRTGKLVEQTEEEFRELLADAALNGLGATPHHRLRGTGRDAMHYRHATPISHTVTLPSLDEIEGNFGDDEQPEDLAA